MSAPPPWLTGYYHPRSDRAIEAALAALEAGGAADPEAEFIAGSLHCLGMLTRGGGGTLALAIP